MFRPPKPGIPLAGGLKGGQEVHPLAAVPVGRQNDDNSTTLPWNMAKNDSIFNLGKAMSGTPIWIGIIKFPNAPINKGVMAKKIMNVPCIINI